MEEDLIFCPYLLQKRDWKHSELEFIYTIRDDLPLQKQDFF